MLRFLLAFCTILSLAGTVIQAQAQIVPIEVLLEVAEGTTENFVVANVLPKDKITLQCGAGGGTVPAFYPSKCFATAAGGQATLLPAGISGEEAITILTATNADAGLTIANFPNLGTDLEVIGKDGTPAKTKQLEIPDALAGLTFSCVCKRGNTPADSVLMVVQVGPQCANRAVDCGADQAACITGGCTKDKVCSAATTTTTTAATGSGSSSTGSTTAGGGGGGTTKKSSIASLLYHHLNVRVASMLTVVASTALLLLT